METNQQIRQENSILPGVLLFENDSEVPAEVLESGDFIAAEEFYEALDLINRDKAQATRVLRVVLSHIAESTSDSRGENVLRALSGYFWDKSTLNPKFYKQVFINTQLLVDIHEEITDGTHYIGFGPVAVEVLGSLLFEIEPVQNFEETEIEAID